MGNTYLNHFSHFVHAVKTDRHDHARHERDPVERGGEHERRAEHEEKQDELEHVRVRERDRCADDPFHGLVRGEAGFDFLVNLKARPLADVPQPAVGFHQVLNPHGDPVVPVALAQLRQPLRFPMPKKVRQLW